MKKLSKILHSDYRVIEFAFRKSLLSDVSIHNTKFLTIIKNAEEKVDNYLELNDEDFIYAIEKNSTDVIIINRSRFRELNSLLRTAEAQLCFVKITFFTAFLLPYFLLKSVFLKRFKFYGLFFLDSFLNVSFYIGIKRVREFKRSPRYYLSPKINIKVFFEKLNDKKIRYSILRWFEKINNLDLHEDIDLIVADNDMEKVHSIILEQPGIIPFDIYSKSGLPGSDFKSLPYYSSSLAEKAINETILFNDIFKVPTWENYFYLLSYHAVFHKGENSGLYSKKYKLTPKIKPDHDYLFHLKNIAAKANLEIEDFTLDGLHTFLEKSGFAPPIDTQYKLSLQNEYLKAFLDEYHNQSEYHNKFEGLVCFVVREKIVEKGLLDDLKKYIQKEGFTILKVINIEDNFKDRFNKKVRGGNWNQGPWPVDGGLPAVLVIALDVYPVKPDSGDYALHPGLSNKRIKNKNDIRDFINKSLPSEQEWFNGIHSSDNEIQAVEYFKLAGVDEDEIYSQIVKYKESFKTKYPVLKILSQHSKRAKVELVSYKGGKAVIKTFKPNCELFLRNEVEGYKNLKNIVPMPHLLEIGPNFIITSYIENSRQLGKKIDMKTLKRCLDILHRIYDKGYSLLDFKPGNFLIDGNGNIFLIDFEFLFKYVDKPEFLKSYDLIGSPNDLDTSLLPNNHIPTGIKQFDALWTKYTGVYYDDLLNLNHLRIFLKSSYRYYYLKLNKRLSKYKNESKRLIRSFLKTLP
jgi:hypothetical protein